MIDLSHIYFSGEEATCKIRPEGRAQTKRAIRSSELGQRGLQKRKRPESDALRALSPLLEFILSHTGLNPVAYQPKVLNRRFSACLRLLRVPSDKAALRVLQQKPELLASSLSAVLIGVSEFFRDKAVFESLRQVILPQALATNRPLRVYSAGCSAGQELYSIGIILDELGALGGSHLLGLDCRPDAVEQARSGGFALSDLKGVGELRRQRYFHIEGRHAFISPQLKQQTAWRVGDFSDFLDTEPWDLILFRNVAIYLETEYASRIWHKLDQQLKPGGIMVTGTAERPPEDLLWQRESTCIYRKGESLTS